MGDAVGAYEELRSHVLTGVLDHCTGLVLLLREGLAAWLECRGAASPALEPTARLCPQSWAPVVSDEIRAGIVKVLASMISAA